jgi:hypothetical protein
MNLLFDRCKKAVQINMQKPKPIDLCAITHAPDYIRPLFAYEKTPYAGSGHSVTYNGFA